MPRRHLVDLPRDTLSVMISFLDLCDHSRVAGVSRELHRSAAVGCSFPSALHIPVELWISAPEPVLARLADCGVRPQRLAVCGERSLGTALARRVQRIGWQEPAHLPLDATATLAAFLSQPGVASRLSKLDVAAVSVNVDRLIRSLPASTPLTELCVGGCYDSSVLDDYDHTRVICQRLTRLAAQEGMPWRQLHACVQPNLTDLSCRGRYHSLGPHNIQCLTHAPGLRRLQFFAARLTDECCRVLGGLRHLTVLHLNSPDRVTDAGLAHLAPLRLVSLSLLFDHSGHQSLTFLSTMPLKRLRLHLPVADDAALEPLSRLSQLQRLELYGTVLDGAGLVHVAHLPLTDLDLSFSSVQPHRLGLLVSIRSLVRLDVRGLDPRVTHADLAGLSSQCAVRCESLVGRVD